MHADRIWRSQGQRWRSRVKEENELGSVMCPILKVLNKKRGESVQSTTAHLKDGTDRRFLFYFFDKMQIHSIKLKKV